MNFLTPHQKKALDYKKHISLTANAGSGKTFVLSKRYLEIALNEKIPLRNIAAITFTDKAAGELYQKIVKEIDDRIRIAEDSKLIENLELIRRQLVSANISTIHSFCIDILREFPVEAGIDANFTPIDEIFADELIELSGEEVIRESLENSADEIQLKYLIRLFSSRTIFSRELKNAIKHRRNILTLKEKVYDKSIDEIAREFYLKFITLTEKILDDDISLTIKSASKINSVVLKSSPKSQNANEIKIIIDRFNKERKFENKLALLSQLKNKILVGKGTIAVRGYLNNKDKELLQPECLQLEGLLKDLNFLEIPNNHEQIEKELANFGKIFIHFFIKTLQHYSDKKKDGGYLDYEDMLLYTQKLIESEELRNLLSEKYKYIMIDEYQDTNELQYNIFLPILDDLKRGNLFVVGDEKQSIYMFRDAELEIFNRTKNEILLTAGDDSLLLLPDSFRMSPNLCLFINVLFTELFNNPNKFFNEVEHNEVVCARDDEESGKIEFLVAELLSGEDDETAEANLISEKILDLVNDTNNKNDSKWGDIAVLCRKRKSFIKLEKEFIQKKIPYTVIGGKGFYQRQSIYDIFNYFTFLLDQNDDTALVGILRSPFFLLSDAEIFELSLEPETTYWEKLKSYSDKNQKIIGIINTLNENLSLTNKVETSFLLRKIISESGYLSLLSSRINAIREEANITKLINQTIKFFNEDFRTLYDYVKYLEEAIEEVEDESQAVVSEEVNSVKVLTIHQAKGLEFPIVFLYRCGETTKKNLVRSKSLSIDKHFGLLTKVPINENYFDDYSSAPLTLLSDYINSRKDTAEIKRLLYVAVTRTKNQLYISATAKSAETSKGDSFISLIKSGLNIEFNLSKIEISNPVKFLINEDGFYFTSKKHLSIDIPIIKKLESKISSNEIEQSTLKIESFHSETILDKPHGEIISATKMSVFKQCPLKYSLIYQLGFSNLMAEYHSFLNTQNVKNDAKLYDFSSKEDIVLSESHPEEISNTAPNFAQLKGIIIHKILSVEIKEEELESRIDWLLKEKIDNQFLDSWQYHDLQKNIKHDLQNFFKSKMYANLSAFKNFKNEFEIYHHRDSYYLYGVIDKLIMDDNKIVVVDYKTDSISAEEIETKAKHYLVQLKFYGYIISKLYPAIREIELNLIFIKHPDNTVKIEVNIEDLKEIESDLDDMVRKTREFNPAKNLNHCEFCNFSIKNKCIVI